MQQFIIDTFKTWVENVLEKKYHFGDISFYQEFLDTPQLSQQNSCNPFIKSEADIQLYWGSFLQQKLEENYPAKRYQTHTEMPIYEGSRKKCDLSIHEIDGLWLHKDDEKKTLICAFEIKMLPIKTAFSQKLKKSILEDLNKLSELSNKTALIFMIIIDESFGLTQNQVTLNTANINERLDKCKAINLIILSNNPNICL